MKVRKERMPVKKTMILKEKRKKMMKSTKSSNDLFEMKSFKSRSLKGLNTKPFKPSENDNIVDEWDFNIFKAS